MFCLCPQTVFTAPAPAPGLDRISGDSMTHVDGSGGKDGSSIEGVGLGIQTDSSTNIPTDGPPVSPTKNPYLDKNRQGAGAATLMPGGSGR